jgi:anti-sigma-K factor RskA
MKPLIPHDPLDDLIAAALHGELTPEERTQFEARLNNDPAAQAAYQEAQAMHDLLEKTHQSAQPDPSFEQRMVSGVRRKIQTEKHTESGLESLLVLWAWLKKFPTRFRMVEVAVVLGIIAILAGVALGPITSGIKQAKQSAIVQLAHQKAEQDYQSQVDAGVANPVMKDTSQFLAQAKAEIDPGTSAGEGRGVVSTSTTTSQLAMAGSPGTPPAEDFEKTYIPTHQVDSLQAPKPVPEDMPFAPASPQQTLIVKTTPSSAVSDNVDASDSSQMKMEEKAKSAEQPPLAQPTSAAAAPITPAPSAAPSAIDTRKLIRNAQLDLEVKSFQSAMDQIATLTKDAGGYIDTSNSQKGGNGKLQGTVVVKVLPQNLDGFLLKLRDLGQVQNQSVSTDDVTKEYFDTQARLDNSRRMETQLQDLLKRENGKVSDLLAVERELGRVRGDIEQMQGQLKLYDFQVQYATVTMQLREMNLTVVPAYLLNEQDDFSLFATDVEGTFQRARQAAD